MSVPVFISYHAKDDAELATELKASLEALTDEFDVFLDKDALKPSDDWRAEIAKAIKRAEWFLIICTGFPRKDIDMMWSFFEAGQFCATLRKPLAEHANKRIVCLFDTEIPSILSEFQGVKVCGPQTTGPRAEILPRDDIKLEESAVFKLLEQMLENEPERALRDPKSAATRRILREESFKLISLFEAAGSNKVVFERSLQPRISFELSPGGELIDETIVKGYEQSLRTLFGIESEEATWSRVVQSCCKSNGAKPAWLLDIESAAMHITNDDSPAYTTNKCVLRDTIYRVYPARYEKLKNGTRVIYIVFLPTTSRPFDLTKRSSTLLSSLILSVRFREQIIPMSNELLEVPAEKLAATLADFYRLLLNIEIEARQFGLIADDIVPGEEAPVTAVFTDRRKKTFIQDAIDDWAKDRAIIETIFVDEPVDLRVPGAAQSSAAQIAGFLGKITKTNAKFIVLLAEELLAQIKQAKQTKERPTPPRQEPARPASPRRQAAAPSRSKKVNRRRS